MAFDALAPINHPSPILAIAVSPDEKWIACGGGESAPVTIWDLASGNLIGRLAGVAGQVHTLAFSADGSRLAAGTVWGGIWVWQTSTGQLLQQREPTTTRRRRALVFLDKAKATALPHQLSYSLNHGPIRALAPDGQWLASTEAGLSITPYRQKGEPITLDYLQYDIVTSGVRSLRWSADSQAVGVAGDGWVGIWRPFEGQFFGRALPSPAYINDIAVLSSTMQLICATFQQNSLHAFEMPPEPLQTRWQTQFQRLVAHLTPHPRLQTRHDWTWNTTQWGYEGVRLEATELLWYSHSHNTMDGGVGATTQSLSDFVARGTHFAIPESVLAEVCYVVQQRLATPESR